ncbi:hypothetical protein HDV05_007221 [Chytridiales sp. JEL 0842]|nr:hypothetical protein HDV05_007221 [Chytridiales sp. JEL 0842]
MKLLSLLWGLATLAGLSSVQSTVSGQPKSSNLLARSYMVELDSTIPNAEEHVRTHLSKQGVPSDAIKFRVPIQNSFFNGISFTIDYDHDEGIVHGLPQINNVWPVSFVPRPEVIKGADVPAYESTETTAQFAKTRRQWSSEPIHSLTGVNDARNNWKYRGKNKTVAIIDTGVYYLHPALGGGIGPDKRIIGGHDFVGDNFGKNGVYTASPDSDPLDNCSIESHGTHVAGIIGGDSTGLVGAMAPPSLMTGVAPDCNMLAYRVFGCEGKTTSDILMAAVDRAIKDKADIINIPFTFGEQGFLNSAITTFLNKAARGGARIVTPVGDKGANGPFFIESPSSAPEVFSVGSFESPSSWKKVVEVGGTSGGYSPSVLGGGFTPASTAPVVFNDPSFLSVVNGTTASYDGCAGVNGVVTGKIVIFAHNPIKPGCGTSLPCSNALAAGAVGCVLYNMINDHELIIDGARNIAGAGVSRTVANLLNMGVNLGQTISFTDTNRFMQNPAGGSLSLFSSQGLTPDLKVKPDFGAIGGNILSTISLSAQTAQKSAIPYAVYSGTGLASAYMAGAVALYMDYYANCPYHIIQQVFQNTASPRRAYGSGAMESVAAQGSGLINVYDAVKTNILAAPPTLALGDIDDLKKSYVLNITNYLPTPSTFNISVEHAVLVSPYNRDSGDIITRKLTGEEAFATVSFAGKDRSKRFGTAMVSNVGYRRSAKVVVTFRPPNITDTAHSIYSGYLRILNIHSREVIRVPFAGVIKAWPTAQIWSRNNTYNLATGLYDNTRSVPIARDATVNATNLISVAKVFAGPTEHLEVEAIYTGADTNLRNLLRSVAGMDRKNVIGYLMTRPAVNSSTLTTERGGPHGRTSFDQLDLSKVFSYWDGTVYTKKNTTLKLPTGRYRVSFSALRHQFPVSRSERTFANDIIKTGNFTLVY